MQELGRLVFDANRSYQLDSIINIKNEQIEVYKVNSRVCEESKIELTNLVKKYKPSLGQRIWYYCRIGLAGLVGYVIGGITN